MTTLWQPTYYVSNYKNSFSLQAKQDWLCPEWLCKDKCLIRNILCILSYCIKNINGKFVLNLLFSFLRFLDGAKKKCRSYLILRSPNNFKYIIEDKKIITIIRNVKDKLLIHWLSMQYLYWNLVGICWYENKHFYSKRVIQEDYIFKTFYFYCQVNSCIMLQ